MILIALKLQIGVCNSQISMFELSTIIMRHEVQFCLVTIVCLLLVRLYFCSIELFRQIMTSFWT